MSDYSSKRIAIRFCTSEAITMIEQLPRGYKSMIVEHAFNAYLESEPGKKLLDQLVNRKRKHIGVSKPSKPNNAVSIEQLNGDF